MAQSVTFNSIHININNNYFIDSSNREFGTLALFLDLSYLCIRVTIIYFLSTFTFCST